MNKVLSSVHGASELESNLIAMAKEFGYRNARNALNKPLKDAMKIVANDISNNTPVDSGFIKSTVKVKSGTGPIAKAMRRTLGPKVKNKSDIVAAASAGWYVNNFYSLVNLEYGNRRQPPTYVIRDSLKNNQDQVIASVRKDWKEALKKTTARLNKRKALGKLKVR